MIGKCIEGYVRDGKVILTEPLEDGTGVVVRVTALPGQFTPEERAKFEAWQALGAESLARFERMIEEQDRNAPG